MWPLSDEECYVSVDIEADGPVPGLNSMLSLGAAAFTSEGSLADTFSVNLERLPEARQDTRTMKWWSSQPVAWKECRTQIQEPEQAMRHFHEWVQRKSITLGVPIMVGSPAAYDAMWILWYLHRFVGDNPFRPRAIDIKTLAMVTMGTGYSATTKSDMSNGRFDRPTHIALEDGH